MNKFYSPITWMPVNPEEIPMKVRVKVIRRHWDTRSPFIELDGKNYMVFEQNGKTYWGIPSK